MKTLNVLFGKSASSAFHIALKIAAGTVRPVSKAVTRLYLKSDIGKEIFQSWC